MEQWNTGKLRKIMAVTPLAAGRDSSLKTRMAQMTAGLLEANKFYLSPMVLYQVKDKILGIWQRIVGVLPLRSWKCE